MMEHNKLRVLSLFLYFVEKDEWTAKMADSGHGFCDLFGFPVGEKNIQA